MNLIAYFLVVPLAMVACITGCIQSAGTSWGFIRHYRVSAKIVMTGFATLALLLKLDLISHAAQLAARPELPRAELSLVGNELLLHAAGGLAILLIPVVLSVYKPRRLTPYGRRSRPAQPIGSVTPCTGDQRPASSARWVGLGAVERRNDNDNLEARMRTWLRCIRPRHPCARFPYCRDGAHGALSTGLRLRRCGPDLR